MMEKENNPNISRKKFLQLCGRMIAGGSILALTGTLLYRRKLSADEAACAALRKGTDFGSDCASCKVNCPLRKGLTMEAAYYWQIDPQKCTQCGRCETHCVLPVSAVKCLHANRVCGYCDLCGGYYRSNVKVLDTAAENLMCPTGAIERKFVEEPYFEYTINEALCNGCGKCVKGCSSFGNGSLYLQIKRDLCKDCNECKIATVCPSDAITRVPLSKAYQLKESL